MPPRVVTPPVVVLLILATAIEPPRRADDLATGTRAEGLRLGHHAVGFDVIHGIDRRRRINAGDGTRLGIAVWYPAQTPAAGAATLTSMEYRLLDRSTAPSPEARRTLESEEIDALVGWRHVGIVALTPEQAKASVETRGIAIRGAVARQGRFPVVVVLGGPYYLSTTAEVLASHGLVVVAPFRFRDQSNELDTGDFRAYVEASLGDAEWALETLRDDPRADLRTVTAVGHGGGGMQAMLLAMRNRSITAVVNVDAGNFSSRSDPGRIAFYAPRLLRVPYLYVATADTRNEQDRFDDFVAMKFSDRTEVVLGAKELRHHDLSDIGRGITMPMRIRGEAQTIVERNYLAVQEMLVLFVAEHSTSGAPAPQHLSDWLDARTSADNLTVRVWPGIAPAPTVAAVLESLGDSTVGALAHARQRDPEAAIFQEDSLSELVAQASARQSRVAAGLAEFAVGVHPTSAVLLAQASALALDEGDQARAVARARACAGLEVDNDWRASIAVEKCSILLRHLHSRDIPRR